MRWDLYFFYDHFFILVGRSILFLRSSFECWLLFTLLSHISCTIRFSMDSKNLRVRVDVDVDEYFTCVPDTYNAVYYDVDDNFTYVPDTVLSHISYTIMSLIV